MWMLKIIFILFIILGINQLVYTQQLTNVNTSYIYRISITPRNIGSKPTLQTGFLIKNKGIVTTLHGLTNETDAIKAIDKDGIKIFDLEIEGIDYEKDLLLLKFKRVSDLDINSNGFNLKKIELENPKKLNKLKKNKTKTATKVPNLVSYGYPAGAMALQKSSILFTLEGNSMDKLDRLLPAMNQDKFSAFKNRKSPDINTFVFGIEGGLGPGTSGSPVFWDEDIVGVVEGGLLGYNKNWCIPYKNTNFKKIDKDLSDKIKRNGATRDLLFYYNPDEEKIENIIKVDTQRIDYNNNILLNTINKNLEKLLVGEDATTKESIKVNKEIVLKNNQMFINLDYDYSYFNNSNGQVLPNSSSLSITGAWRIKSTKFVVGAGYRFRNLYIPIQVETLPDVFTKDSIEIKSSPVFLIQYYFLPLKADKFNISTGLLYTLPKSIQPFIGLSIPTPIYRRAFFNLKFGYDLINSNHGTVKFNFYGDADVEQTNFNFKALTICGGIHFFLP